MKLGDLVTRPVKQKRFVWGRMGHYGVIYEINERDKENGRPVTVSVFWDDGEYRKNYRANLLEVVYD